MSGRSGVPEAPLVAIGVGNVLLRDDAVGVRVIEALRRQAETDPGALPEGTRLVDGGTLGLDLLRHLDAARGLLLVDAGARDEPPGTVTIRRDADVLREVGADAGGGHGIGELLAAAGLLGVLPRAIAVVEIGVGEIGVGVGLTRDVEAALPHAVDAALRELAALDARTGWPPRTADVGDREPAGATA